MQIVITMAGLGSRFRKAGYDLPKYMIEVMGKTLFEWSMLSLQMFKTETYIFIVRKEDKAENFIQKKCIDLGISRFQIIGIDYLTSGQAETAMLAEHFWDDTDSLLIYNIDTFVEPPYLLPENISGDGFIPCFNGAGDHWSFVKLDTDDNVVEVTEKIRISDNCTVGAYYFKSANLYSKIYHEYYSEGQYAHSEKYVAPLYNQLIQNGGKIHISTIPIECVHVLGTPEEVEEFKMSFASFHFDH